MKGCGRPHIPAQRLNHGELVPPEISGGHEDDDRHDVEAASHRTFQVHALNQEDVSDGAPRRKWRQERTGSIGAVDTGDQDVFGSVASFLLTHHLTRCQLDPSGWWCRHHWRSWPDKVSSFQCAGRTAAGALVSHHAKECGTNLFEHRRLETSVLKYGGRHCRPCYKSYP